MLTLFQLGMAVLGACAYTADEHLYPELDEAGSMWWIREPFFLAWRMAESREVLNGLMKQAGTNSLLALLTILHSCNFT